MDPQVQALSKKIVALQAEGDALLAKVEFSDADGERLKAIKAEIERATDDVATIEAYREQRRVSLSASPVVGVTDELDKKAAAGVLFSSLGEQLQAIYAVKVKGDNDARMKLMAAAQGAGSATDSDGGFLIQKQFVNDIQERMVSMSSIIPLCRELPIGANANGTTINVVDETSRATGSRWGGVQGYWVDEGTAPTATKPKFARMELKLKKLAALGYATDELLEDATALGGVMNQAFAEELVWLTENSIFNGNGTGQPLGFVGHAATISQAAETGQVAATVVYENIINMWAHLLPRSQRNAAWFVGPDVLPQIDQLGLAVGTGVLPPRFVDYGPDGVLRIKGRPVIVHEYSQALGTAGDIVLADLSSYLLATKGGVRSDTSMHVAFTTDEMAFRAIYRVDGQPAMRTYITLANSYTVSAFVKLATR
jgi:HK97 family phage major capsid protein